MDGTVKFGPMEEGYRQFVQQMADWYAEGLLDPDFATVDKSTVQAKFANGESGLSIQQIGNIETGMAANEGTSFEAVPLRTAVLNKGDTRLFGHFTSKYDGSFAHAVSPGDKQDLAMRWCDYLFSQEGQYLTAYGQEGITYTVDENGEFAGFTDFILHNTEIEEEPRIFWQVLPIMHIGLSHSREHGFSERIIIMKRSRSGRIMRWMRISTQRSRRRRKNPI